jgi:hypothetical protein
VGTKVQEIHVQSAVELENSVLSYIAQGFAVSNRTEDSVTLFKKKEFNILWAIIGFFLCWIPLIIYAITYSNESDQMIVIRVGHARVLTWSEDRKWWSDDGATWHDASGEMPVGATLSDDKLFWWDGTVWCPVPLSEQAQITPPVAPPPPPPPPVQEAAPAVEPDLPAPPPPPISATPAPTSFEAAPPDAEPSGTAGVG